MRIGLLHPGEMGAAVGALLVQRGHEVLWQPRGRSAQSEQRAREAGLSPTEHFDDVALILSICPPHAALEVARSLAGTQALVLDANAVSPGTARRIGAILGERWVDGGIVGPPPVVPGVSRLFLSGARAPEVAELFAGSRLEPIVLASSAVAASTLKMTYAAWTKGTAALVLAVRAAAREGGVEPALLDEWARSQPDLEQRSVAAAGSAATKGWRWVAEMEEIAATLAGFGLPPGFHEAAAEVYRRTSALAERSTDAVIDALATREG